MSSRYNSAFKVSVILHGIVLGVAIGLPLLTGTCQRKKPEEQVVFVSLVAPDPPAPVAVPPPPAPPPPRPEPPPPRPEPPPPAPPPPEPPPPPPPRRTVQVNTNRVVRTAPPPPAPTPAPRRVSPDEIAAQLLAGLPLQTAPATPAASPNERAAYHARIQAILYEHWEQPPGMPGLKTQVSIRIARNGAIIQKNVIAGSGNDAMDSSVQRALNRATGFPRLPDSIGGAFHDVTITFQSTGSF